MFSRLQVPERKVVVGDKGLIGNIVQLRTEPFQCLKRRPGLAAMSSDACEINFDAKTIILGDPSLRRRVQQSPGVLEMVLRLPQSAAHGCRLPGPRMFYCQRDGGFARRKERDSLALESGFQRPLFAPSRNAAQEDICIVSWHRTQRL